VEKSKLEEGKKYDDGKPRVDLVSSEFIEGMGVVRGFGAGKYGDWNWANGIKFSRNIAAALRHLLAFARGEDIDPESGESHLLHAACCLEHLYVNQLYTPEYDDRWKRPSKEATVQTKRTRDNEGYEWEVDVKEGTLKETGRILTKSESSTPAVTESKSAKTQEPLQHTVERLRAFTNYTLSELAEQPWEHPVDKGWEL